MKCLCIDGIYFRFPEGYDTIEEFIDALNTGELPTFIRMIQLDGMEEGTGVYPFFIEEKGRECYVNIRTMAGNISEGEVTILPRREYERRMRDLSKWLCAGCLHAQDTPDFKGCIDDMCLDGTCYCKMTDEDEGEW